MVDIFKALAEESRLRILALLLQGEKCVCEIENCLKMTQSNVSRHLTALRNCGILECSKTAQWAHYKISEEFRRDNLQLWLYLESRLKELPSFKADMAEYERLKGQDLCNVRSECNEK
ncbi:MAG TPA: metalloregulator ArsR/SmtB family transcription factor [Clostridia bacterium]|nr:metalloregulator ArsR/SmtB family transcription factor [Clostridia bacterium]